MNFRTVVAVVVLALAAALSGCAAYTIDKTIEPSPQEVAAIGREIAKVRDFHQAVYDVSTFAVDRCARQTLREPFALLTTVSLRKHLTKEQLAAYWRAGGYDETWRVLWALEGSGLAPGDVVLRINGTEIENNGWDKAPLQVYFNEAYSGQREAESGKPFRITLASGEEREMPMKPACRTMVWAMPLTGRNDSSDVSTVRPIVIPPSAIQMAQSQDELRYLAALAVYFSASAEANTRRWIGATGMLVGTVLPGVAPLTATIAAQSAALNIAGRVVATSGMVENAAHFATQVVADMGGSPHAGLDLIARLEASQLGATRVVLKADEQARVRELAGHLRTTSAGR